MFRDGTIKKGGYFRGRVTRFSLLQSFRRSPQSLLSSRQQRDFFGRGYSSLGMKPNKIVFEKLVLIFSRIFSLLLRANPHYSVHLQA